MKKENEFQADLMEELRSLVGRHNVFKIDGRQGIPDILVLCGDKWAMLECKKSADAAHQPNQDYHVERLNRMGFSRFIFPENKEEVLNELCEAFGIDR